MALLLQKDIYTKKQVNIHWMNKFDLWHNINTILKQRCLYNIDAGCSNKKDVGRV